MTWATATDDQLRRAAAERVMGWEVKESTTEGFGLIAVDDPDWPDFGKSLEHNWEGEGFFPERNRDDLARVFRAGWPKVRGPLERLAEVETAWALALEDPRAALVALLDLLFPDGPDQ